MKKIAYDENKTISFMAKTDKDNKGNAANIKITLSDSSNNQNILNGKIKINKLS